MDKEYEFFAKNIVSHPNKNNEENNNSNFAQIKSKKGIIDHLNNALLNANAEIDRLHAKLKENEINAVKGQEIVNQRNELLKLLSQRDNTIERKSMEIRMLEKQLEDAVSAKFDALARLDAAGVKKVHNLSHSSTSNRTEVMDQRSTQRRKRNQTKNRSDNNSAMDESSDSASIQDELLSVARTRRQKQHILDAFDGDSSRWPDEGAIQKSSTKNVEMVSVERRD